MSIALPVGPVQQIDHVDELRPRGPYWRTPSLSCIMQPALPVATACAPVAAMLLIFRRSSASAISGCTIL